MVTVVSPIDSPVDNKDRVTMKVSSSSITLSLIIVTFKHMIVPTGEPPVNVAFVEDPI
jgi:hypothetical protein